MKSHLKSLGLTVLVVVVLDLTVAIVLTVSDGRVGVLQPLVNYFEFGRSVPGKLDRWTKRPDIVGNLYDVAWRSDVIANSEAEFAVESSPGGPVVRAYSMSFVNNILQAAKEARPELQLDLHSGPGAPPNFTYAVFLDDRANRRAGDVVVLGILSSSVAAMAAMSNRSWVFEQPAPFTYPIFLADGKNLRRIDPLINSAEAERALSGDPDTAREWQAFLQENDAFYSFASFDWPTLDKSPFFRLLRRSLAIGRIEKRKTELLGEESSASFPYDRILQLMVESFARTARQDNQVPVVMLIQTQGTETPDLLKIMKPTLERNNIPYVATAEHVSAQDPSVFRSDGHYKIAVDKMFARAFLVTIAAEAGRK